MMKPRCAHCLVLGVVILSTACKTTMKADMVGTWHSSMAGAETTYHFRPDHTFSIENQFNGCLATASGDYSVEAEKLIMTPKVTHVDGPEPLASQLRQTITQPSRLTMRTDTPFSITLMPQSSTPLMINKTSPTP